MRTRRDDLPLTADINVTTLVDVAFTLLVIFIITAPALQGGIEIDVPEADVRSVPVEDKPFIVSIHSDGTVYVGETPLTGDFRAELGQLVTLAAPAKVFLRGDSSARWETAVQVMGVLNSIGTDVVVVAEPMEDG